MARLDPRPDDQLGDLEDVLAVGEKRLGFRPNSQKTMAWRPEILRGYQGLAQAVFAPGTVPSPIKQMVANMVSYAAGCRYCQAHTGSVSTRTGVTEQKLAVLWDFEKSPMFSDAERVALRVAFAAGQVPNAVTDAEFAALKTHYTPEQIVELMSVICLMGFLNRWNDTFATDLEDIPMAFGNQVLAPLGWSAGKHGPEAAAAVVATDAMPAAAAASDEPAMTETNSEESPAAPEPAEQDAPQAPAETAAEPAVETAAASELPAEEPVVASTEPATDPAAETAPVAEAPVAETTPESPATSPAVAPAEEEAAIPNQSAEASPGPEHAATPAEDAPAKPSSTDQTVAAEEAPSKPSDAAVESDSPSGRPDPERDPQ